MTEVFIAFVAVAVMTLFTIGAGWLIMLGEHEGKETKQKHLSHRKKPRRHRSGKRWRHTDKIDEPSSTEDLAGAAAFSIKGTTIALSPLLIVLAVFALIFLALLCAKDLNAYPPIFTHVHP